MARGGATLSRHDIDRTHKFDWEVDGFAGMDNSSDPSSLANNVSPNVLNSIYDLTGAIESRRGYTKLNTTSFPGAIINEHPFYKSDGSKSVIFAGNATDSATAPGGVTGTYLCKYDNAGGYTIIGGPYAVGTFWDFTTLNDAVYACNGANGVLVWTGSGSFIVSNPTLNIQFIENRKNRLYGLIGNILYFTDAGNPASWPANNYVQVNTNDNQVGTGLKKYFDDLVIFKTQSVWYLQGEPLGSGLNTTIGNLQLRQADSEVGCPSILTVKKVRRGVLMWGCEAGVAVMQNYHVDIISEAVEKTFSTDMNTNFLNKMWAIYSPPEKKYLLGYPSAGSSTPDKVLLVDMGNPTKIKFAVWDHYPGSCAILFRFTGRDSVLIGHPTKGYIVQAFQGYADIAGDNGSATSATATTLSDTTKAWTGGQFIDADVTIISGTGAGQRRTISANTANQLTLTLAWTVTPDATSVYSIGAYASFVDTPIEDFGKAAYDKKIKYMNIFTDSHSGENLLFGHAIAYQSLSFSDAKSISGGGLIWGQTDPDTGVRMKWGKVGKKWGSKKQLFLQFEIGDVDKKFQARFGNNRALQPWRVSMYTITLKFKKVRPDVV